MVVQTGRGRWTGEPFARIIDEVGSVAGISEVFLLDTSGRILAASGAADPDELIAVSALVLAACDSGSRLHRALTEARAVRITISGEDQQPDGPSVVLLRFTVEATREPLILALLATRVALESLGTRLEKISGAASTEDGERSTIGDTEGLGDSLLANLDQLFP